MENEEIDQLAEGQQQLQMDTNGEDEPIAVGDDVIDTQGSPGERQLLQQQVQNEQNQQLE